MSLPLRLPLLLSLPRAGGPAVSDGDISRRRALALSAAATGAALSIGLVLRSSDENSGTDAPTSPDAAAGANASAAD
ncbi:twin-arginine translocation signal domain-containing protein [Streptomyces sp. NPDC058470]|uniref:twin-arginine translocation signal domain-containing protein n=1 Tax=Streptomyces sp. NPDC058470 TaxID=3346515 RepID=UPI003654E036